MKRNFPLILACVLVTALASCASCKRGESYQGPRKNILVIHEMPFLEQTSARLHSVMQKEFGDTSKYSLRYMVGSDAAYIRMMKSRYFDDQSAFILHELRKVKTEPDLIIVFGDLIAQTVAGMEHPWFREKPVLCLNVKYPEWQNNRLRQRKNFAGMIAKPEPKKSVDFIRELGGPSWIVVGLDNTFVDEKLRSSILEQMGGDQARYATNLEFETCDRLIDASVRDQSRSVLIPINQQDTDGTGADSVYNAGFRIPGIFMCRNNQSAFLRLKDDCYIDKSFGYNLGLYFSESPRYFDLPLLTSLCANIGGYFTPWESLMSQAHPIVDKLLEGAEPSSIPWTIQTKEYWLDWRLAKSIHKYSSEFPEHINFVNLPWQDKSALNNFLYKYWRYFAFVLILIIAVAVPVSLHHKNMKIHKALVAQGEKAAQNQKQTEALLETINAYTWEMLPDDTIELNDVFVKLAGLERKHYKLQSILDHVEKGAEELRAAIDDTSSLKTTVEVLVNIPNRREHAFIIYVNHIDNGEGVILCNGFIVLNDEAYEAEKLRQEAESLAEETAVKESFLAAMSHEIRNPLNTIVGFADVLAKRSRELSNEERAEFSALINDSMEHLLKLLEDVVNYSSVNEEQMSLELSRLDVGKVMEEVYITHEYIMPENLQLRIKRGPAGIMLANRSAILQIMSNLMNNAIKFTPSGTVTIGWDIVGSGEDSEVQLYVQDTGNGISEENKDLIFRNFYKTDSHSVGAGIGLSLCMRLARAMNGTISLESEVGNGSKFILKLGGYNTKGKNTLI